MLRPFQHSSGFGMKVSSEFLPQFRQETVECPEELITQNLQRKTLLCVLLCKGCVCRGGGYSLF